MCFSTEASFTAAAVLTTTGILTLKNISSRNQFFIASIPLLFALQQLAEGFIWLHLSYQIGPKSLLLYAQKTFLTFAFLVWPIWISLSLAMVESILWQRILLWIIFGCGVILSFMNLFYGLQENVSVQVVNHSLQYMGHVPDQTIAYPLVILLPLFLSSLRNIWIFGMLVAVGYFVAEYFYFHTFVSVWCFFSAMVSLSIYKILKDNSSDTLSNHAEKKF